MITAADQTHIYAHAYMPEHLPAYVTAVSGAEPYLFSAYVGYKKDDLLVFIGYPLGEDFEEKRMKKALDRATDKLKPAHVALIAPFATACEDRGHHEITSDAYYRLEVGSLHVPQNARNMINRASKLLVVETERECGEEHPRLISEFLEARHLSDQTKYIFSRIPAYAKASETAVVLNARNRDGTLVGFDIAEFGAKEYSFYMFNFASKKLYVPGASDLLLDRLIQLSRDKGKRFINLGLGINKGVTFFKTKWGGVPFLPYEYCRCEVSRKQSMDDLWRRL